MSNKTKELKKRVPAKSSIAEKKYIVLKNNFLKRSRLYTTVREVCGLQDLNMLEKSKAITPEKGARAETR